MKKMKFSHVLKPVLVLSLAYSFALTAIAQNYYPADIGNIWVFESVDGTEQSTYTLEGPEIIDGQEQTLLKISTEDLSTGERDTDTYFLTVGAEAIELHKTIFELVDPPAIVTADFPTPVTFFPLNLELGDKWQIAADADAKLEIIPAPISGKSITDLAVVGFEEVVTPAGTFQNCAKVRLDVSFTAGGFLTINSNTYQWFAPDIGPVQYENNDGLIFGLISSNLLTVPEEPEATETDIPAEPPQEPEATETDIPAEPPAQEETLPYDVTADGVVNILDLTFVASRFGENNSDADVTGDGIVNILDLVRIAQNFGN